MPIVSATFETRREAELAVEHLVQQHGVDREEIIVGPEGGANSAGTEASGADEPTDFEDNDDEEAALAGAIVVAVTTENDDQAETVQEFLEEFGGGDVTIDE